MDAMAGVYFQLNFIKHNKNQNNSMKKIFIFIFFVIYCVSNLFGATYTWTGATSSAWNTSTNWSPNGVPDSMDIVTIVSTTNSPTLSQNRKVNKLTLTSGTLNLSGFELTSKGGDATFTSGTVMNGSIKALNRIVSFNGTHFYCRIVSTPKIRTI